MHGMNANLFDLSRLLQNLIRLGTIADVKGIKARVRLGPTLITECLKWPHDPPAAPVPSRPHSRRTGDRLSPGGDLTRGIIVSALYSQEFDAPEFSGPMFACIIDMSYLLWTHGIDIRMLKKSQIEDGWIRIKLSKTQKPAAML
ncbi:hypothetical protein [Janthinobacterium sp. NKUCC06_STL]|uniref:hypothetical protein n=1 Tax=Janthinobacterium sp. NKUCC06_STL TaxID=2842127 RepID=UPI001C5BD7AE|nr:hypothetical protein [Janthinobacterium sp. NKUCC06_STL]MBW3507914.1 phage baseplate assembly protein V [Janthinobacterium sp. NKUCC06_STL]